MGHRHRAPRDFQDFDRDGNGCGDGGGDGTEALRRDEFDDDLPSSDDDTFYDVDESETKNNSDGDGNNGDGDGDGDGDVLAEGVAKTLDGMVLISTGKPMNEPVTQVCFNAVVSSL